MIVVTLPTMWKESVKRIKLSRDKQILDMERKKGRERQSDLTKNKNEHLDLAIPEARHTLDSPFL